MKNIFPEYNPLSEATLKELWDEALIVFDANVLLNLYRYSDETSRKFIETIVKLKSRIWLPYQVGFEFNKNRLEVISDQKKHYLDFEKKFNDIIGDIDNKNRNPFLSKKLTDKLGQINDEIKKEVSKKVEVYEAYLNLDKLLVEINSAFEGKVGPELSNDETKKICTEGEARYKNKVPPGYRDNKKNDDQKFGDLIIWKQLIAQSKLVNSNIIFVLDDRKEDWWLEHQGKTISPRPELLKEFQKETNHKCHFYQPFQFLNFSNEYLGSKIEEKIIEEVKFYKFEQSESDSHIRVDCVLQGSQENLRHLVADMTIAGYDVFVDSFGPNEIICIHIILPKIPDLERRLNKKYLYSLAQFGLALVNTSQYEFNKK